MTKENAASLDWLEGPSEKEVSGVAAQAVGKLKKIEEDLQSLFLEREELIKDFIRTLAIGEHMFIVGPPGTGKSLLAREGCSHIEGGNFFEWLLNRTTDPSALLGPYSIKAMEKDKFIRKSSNMLPEAHVVFLDEIGKANEPVLNILLSILNERIYHNDGKPVPVPLRTLVAASNEMLDDDGISALYDRLLFRHQVNRIKDPSNRIKMLRMTVNQRVKGSKQGYKTRITLSELEMLSNHINNVALNDTIYRTFEKLLRELDAGHGITISDRRAVASMRVLQAEAALNNRDRVALPDFKAITHVLWERPEDLEVIEEEISKLVNPFDLELKKLKKRIQEIHESVKGIEERSERTNKAIEAKAHYEEVMRKLMRLVTLAREAGHDPGEIKHIYNRAYRLNQKMLQECLGIGESNDNELQSPF